MLCVSRSVGGADVVGTNFYLCTSTLFLDRVSQNDYLDLTMLIQCLCHNLEEMHLHEMNLNRELLFAVVMVH
jgi:hypothetical protein